MSVIQAGYRDLRRQKLSKHPQNPYSIERGDRKRSKTPSHALIDAAGGPHHHFECIARALSGPSRTRSGKAGPQGLIRGRGFSVPERNLLLPKRPGWAARSSLVRLGPESARVVHSK